MTEIIPFEEKFELSGYSGMLEIINRALPAVEHGTRQFNKTQSQFMDNTLTVSHYTPIRNLRQILAEMKKTRLALGEAYYGVQKKKLDIEEKTDKLVAAVGIDRKRLEIEIEELEWQIYEINQNVEGAIRKLTNYSLQYQAIQESHGLKEFTEEDFENEEEKYHIITAFSQGLNAARANGGRIDEGNQIYFQQIGINGTAAQQEVMNYFAREGKILDSGQLPGYEMQVEWLFSMAEKFKGCSRVVAKLKGMPDTKTVDAMVSRG